MTGVCPRCLEPVSETSGSCSVHRLSPDPLVGAIIGGAYRVDRMLGQGGMGRVYDGHDVRLDRRVAIKTLLPTPEAADEAVRRFQREARAVAKLGHQNIVTVFDVGELDGIGYLVMEHLSGETLGDRLHRDGPMAIDDALHIAGQIGRALLAAHRAGLIHRDLKPANVMLVVRDEDESFAKLLDFGLAKAVVGDAASEESALTQAGMAIGTPQYMAPEQCAAKELDPRCDQYALGVLVYSMLRGRPPFDGPTPAVLLAQLTEPPPPVAPDRPDLPGAAEAVLMKALSKRADDRFPDVGRFLQALRATAVEGATAAEFGAAPATDPADDEGDGAAVVQGGPLTRAVEQLAQPDTTLSSAVLAVPSKPAAAARKGPIAAVAAVMIMSAIGGAALLGGGVGPPDGVPRPAATPAAAPSSPANQPAVPAGRESAAESSHDGDKTAVEPDAGTPDTPRPNTRATNPAATKKGAVKLTQRPGKRTRSARRTRTPVKKRSTAKRSPAPAPPPKKKPGLDIDLGM